MNQLLGKEDIEAAINLGIQTLAKYEHATSAKYKNTLNSHVKGRLGEFALSKWLRDHQVALIAHFESDQFDQYCDIEVPTANSFKSVEVKTWSSEFWESWGRCRVPHSCARFWRMSGFSAAAGRSVGAAVATEIAFLPRALPSP